MNILDWILNKPNKDNRYETYLEAEKEKKLDRELKDFEFRIRGKDGADFIAEYINMNGWNGWKYVKTLNWDRHEKK